MTKYSIGQVSKLLGIPIRTIRYYESIDLIKPHWTDPETNYRYYSIQDLFRLDLIRCLGKVAGLPLETIRTYIAHENDPELLKAFLQQQERETNAQINELFKRKAFLNRKLQAVTLRSLTEMYRPEFELMPERRIYVRSEKANTIEEILIKARRCSIDAANQYAYTHYTLRDINPDTLHITNQGDVLVGIDENTGAAYTEYVLPAGNYLQITYQGRQGGRSRAIGLMSDFLKSEGLRPEGKIIFKGSLIDATSVYSDDYYLTLELRVK